MRLQHGLCVSLRLVYQRHRYTFYGLCNNFHESSTRIEVNMYLVYEIEQHMFQRGNANREGEKDTICNINVVCMYVVHICI